MHEPIKYIVAERILNFVAKDGKQDICCLSFSKPYKVRDHWYQCDYQILGGPLEHRSKDYGIDSLDAFLSAVTRANIELAYRFEGKFDFEGSDNLDLVVKDYTQVES